MQTMLKYNFLKILQQSTEGSIKKKENPHYHSILWIINTKVFKCCIIYFKHYNLNFSYFTNGKMKKNISQFSLEMNS